MIGRKQEIAELNRIYNRNKAELVAVYGRRRVGKTYLVDQVFKRKISFRHAGLSPIEMKEMSGRSPMQKQLKHFYISLIGQGMKKSVFFASPFWKKLQRKNGQPCMSKMDNVATGHPSM